MLTTIERLTPTLHAQAFAAFVREGERAAEELLRYCDVGPEERHLLMGSQGDLGGFLLPPDTRPVVLGDRPSGGVMRRIARVESTGRDTLVFPVFQSHSSQSEVYSTGFVGAWKQQGYVSGGTAPPIQDQPTFGQTRMPVHSWQPDAIEVSRELADDSQADLVGAVSRPIAERLGVDEDQACLAGNGAGKPLGILEHPGIGSVNSGSASAITYDGLVDLFTSLPEAYHPGARFLMNRITLRAALKIKDSAGDPLIAPNGPLTLWGKPIELSPWMPAIAAGATPIIFGDFFEYIIADRHGIRVQRLTDRFAPNVGLLPFARLGGQVSRPQAFRKQVIAA